LKDKNKIVLLGVDHEIIEVKCDDDEVHLAGSDDSKDGSDKGAVKTPMPATVVKIFVKAGDTVKKGDRLLVLEAMKMEQIIKAPKDGKVKGVHVKEASFVAQGSTVVTIE
jgi:biotin carboxyl carrier protein